MLIPPGQVPLPPGRKPLISRVERLSSVYSRMKRGMSYPAALREVNESFDIAETPVTPPVIRVRGIAENGGYPLEIIPGEIEVGVDEGIPGSDQTAIAVASGGKVVATFGIIPDGDDFVVRAEDGSILGRGSSEEDIMEIIQAMLYIPTFDKGIPGFDQTAAKGASGRKIVNTFMVKQEGDELVVRDEDGSILGKCRSKEKLMDILHTISAEQAVEELSEEGTSRFDIIDME